MTDAILLHRERGLLTLQLNRPDKKNALTRAMYTQLAEALEQADADSAISAVLIQGSSECFTAGNDIGDFLEQPPSDLDSPAVSLYEKPAQLPQAGDRGGGGSGGGDWHNPAAAL